MISLSTTQARQRSRDEGTVLPMALIFVTVSAFIVLALMSFAISLFINRPPLEERSDSLEAVRSATRMAITMQRSHGPNGCYQSSSGSFNINGHDVAITCSVLDNLDDTGGRYALISTSTTGIAGRNNSGIAASGSAKNVRGSVFVNGGNLAADTAAIQMVAGDLLGAAPASYGVDEFRYSALPTTTGVLVPAGGDCTTFFGPNVVSTSFSGAEFGTSKDNITATRAVLPLLTVDVDRDTGQTELLGVIVSGSDGQVMLDRDRANNHSMEVSAESAAATVTQVEVCSQPAPNSSPDFIPLDTTFCGSPLMEAEMFSQPSGETLTCDSVNWWDVAGWKANVTVPYSYPMLPQIPTYQRSAVPNQVGSSNCYVFYPGRYSDALDLDGANEYYFASGVYVFEDEVVVRNGASVVGGEGNWDGCTFDAEASFLPGSPRNHEITGKGVTFLLSSSTGPVTNGTLEVDDASVRLNHRIATTSTRASSGISIMTINEASAANADPVIPANDRVLLPGCLQSEVPTTPSCAVDIGTYSITPIQGGTALSYRASQLTGTDVAVDVDLSGSNIDTNRFMIDGAVFTPNAAVDIRRTATSNPTDYQVVLSGGVTASTIELDFAQGDSTRLFIGEEAASVYQRVQLTAATVSDNRDYLSTVELEVDNAERYAINSWTVGADQSPTGTTAPPATGPATTAVGTPPPDPWIVEIDKSTPLAHWRLGEGSGASTAVDRMGVQNGTYSGSPNPTLGVPALFGGDPDTAAGFAGGSSASRVAIQSSSAINSRTVDTRTIELFFNASGTGSRQVLYEEGGSGNGFNVYLSGSTLYSHAWSSDWSNNLLTSTSFTPGVTYHVVASLDALTSQTLVLYVNGVQASTATKTDGNALRSHSGAIGIGAREGATKFHDGNSSGSEQNEFAGTIDEVVLYDAALDAATVAAHYTSATSTPAPTPTTTTTTTTTSTTSTTTTTTSTTTTTTTLPPGYDYCGVLPNSGWTYDNWGPGDWTVEHWTNQNLSGTPAATVTRSQVNENYGGGDNPTIGEDNNFSVRWTRTIDVQSTCDVRFRGGGDDGFRLYVDNIEVLARWWDHGYQTEEGNYTLTPGQHTIVYEFYENGGSARATLEWRRN